jgi:hypothetical protein
MSNAHNCDKVATMKKVQDTRASGRAKPKEQRSGKAVVSVVTVIDFSYQGERSFDNLKATMSALAAQDFDGPLEFLLPESTSLVGRLPRDLKEILPSLRIVPHPAATSYELMNAGAEAATADIVAFIDADCVPCPEWIRMLVETLERHPEATGVSGRTGYAGLTAWERIMALLSRSYIDPGRSGPTEFFSNNNGGMRRDVWIRNPLPTNAGPYASRVQIEKIKRNGGRFLFEPRMRLTHDYEGWRMEVDIRRHHGFSTVITRLMDRAMPHAWLVRLGYISIPMIVAGKTFDNWRDCLRCARHYGVRWYQVPFAMALSVVLHLMELPGMIRAFRGLPLTRTAYR